VPQLAIGRLDLGELVPADSLGSTHDKQRAAQFAYICVRYRVP
jgi:hypothetical protein